MNTAGFYDAAKICESTIISEVTQWPKFHLLLISQIINNKNNNNNVVVIADINFAKRGSPKAAPTTMSKQHCRMLQVKRFFRQSRNKLNKFNLRR